MHALPAYRDEVRPLGPARRAVLGRRAFATTAALAALVALSFSPLLALVLFALALAVVMDGRGAFGAGRRRGFIGFVTAPWIGLAGVGLALLGSIPEPGNFFRLPGLLLVAISIALLVWSFFTIWRTRPGRRRTER